MNWWEMETFYNDDTTSDIKKGSIVFTPVLFMDPTRLVLKVERNSVDIDTHDGGNCTIEKLDYDKHFRQQAITLPVYNIGLRINEELLVNKAKMRPCVVLSVDAENIEKPTENDNAVPALNKQSLFLLPLYGFDKGTTDIPKYSPIMRKRIMCLQYNKLLFFPKDTEGRNSVTKDSFGRLDMCFTAPKSYVKATGREISSIYMELLDLYLASYLHMETPDEIYGNGKTILELAQEQYSE